MSSHAIVKVVLRSSTVIASPILSREQADQDLERISTARMQGDEIVLPWISVLGGDVEAAHLEDRAAPARERLG